jgi:hypothetical protein
MAPPHAPLSLGGGHISQMNPTVGGQPPFSFGSNPSLNAPRWSTQPSRQSTSYIPSFPPSSSMSILTNTFFIKNPSLSSEVPPGGSQFHAMGNPQPEAPPVGENIYNPHYATPTGMVPIQTLMNKFGGGYYPTKHGPGIYQNPAWPAIPQHQSFRGAWARTPQPRLPFLATLNLPYFSRLMNDPVHHDPSWLPIPTNIPSNIPKFEGKTSEDPSDHVTTFRIWCSSNSLNDDSIHLRLFQRTLTGVSTKWYIGIPGGTYRNWFVMMLTYNLCQPFAKIRPCISQTISNIGVDGRG